MYVLSRINGVLRPRSVYSPRVLLPISPRRPYYTRIRPPQHSASGIFMHKPPPHAAGIHLHYLRSYAAYCHSPGPRIILLSSHNILPYVNNRGIPACLQRHVQILHPNSKSHSMSIPSSASFPNSSHITRRSFFAII